MGDGQVALGRSSEFGELRPRGPCEDAGARRGDSCVRPPPPEAHGQHAGPRGRGLAQELPLPARATITGKEAMATSTCISALRRWPQRTTQDRHGWPGRSPNSAAVPVAMSQLCTLSPASGFRLLCLSAASSRCCLEARACAVCWSTASIPNYGCFEVLRTGALGAQRLARLKTRYG